jgi:hypothetical protein
MRSFLVAALALGLAACGGKQAKDGASEGGGAEGAPPPPTVPVPESCDEPEAAAAEAREGDKPPAVFALAECQHLRWAAAEKAGGQAEAKLADIAALYGEAIASQVPKYVIGGHIRTGDLYLAAGQKMKARESFETGLNVATDTEAGTRQELDVADWIKAACKHVKQLGGNEGRFKVCHPWKEAWR